MDPAAFADAVVQIYLDNAGDLELVAKSIESSEIQNLTSLDTVTLFLRLYSQVVVLNLEQLNLMRGSATLTL
nr:Basic leucine zipper and W2 domain-containing protein 2 [Ipomoea batatas]